MSDDKIFCDGLIYKAPRDTAPDFVKGSLSIKVEEFVAFLQKYVKPDGWVNIDIKESKGGRLYTELSRFVRDEAKAEPPADDINPDDVPF